MVKLCLCLINHHVIRTYAGWGYASMYTYLYMWKCVTSLMSWQVYFCTNCTAEGANPTNSLNVLPEIELFAPTGIEP
jgi:hypothetical protein